MKSHLVWRMLVPTLIVSLLLLAMGLGAAWYVYRWNYQVSNNLHRQLVGVMAAEGLVLSVRDVRVELGRCAKTGDPEFVALARASAAKASHELLRIRPQANAMNVLEIDPLEAEINQLVLRLDRLDHLVDGQIESLQDMISDSVLVRAQHILNTFRESATIVSRQNQEVSERVGVGLAMLGLCGSVAGLLFGFGIARSVARSVDQLDDSVRQVADALSVDEKVLGEGSAGIHDLVLAMSRVSDKTATVMSELEQSRAASLRMDQLATVGQLAAGIAHELRNPLASVKLLLDTAVEDEIALSAHDLVVAQAEVARIEIMLRSFLEFARPPRLCRVRADICQTVSNAVELVRPRASQQRVVIDCNTPDKIEVMIDHEQIRQVVVNILNNALDAQPDGGSIYLTLMASTEEEESRCVVHISDTGPGIPHQLGDSVFKPFVSSKDAGIGLGLAICRRIMEAHDGTIEVEPNPLGGAMFTLRLPMTAHTLTATPVHA